MVPTPPPPKGRGSTRRRGGSGRRTTRGRRSFGIEHRRVHDLRRTFISLAREKRRAHELRGRDRLRAACPSADPFIEALVLRGEHLGGQVTRLLKLLDRYDATEVEAALQDALGRGAIGAASVARVLDQRARARKRTPKLDVVLPDDPRVRDLGSCSTSAPRSLPAPWISACATTAPAPACSDAAPEEAIMNARAPT